MKGFWLGLGLALGATVAGVAVAENLISAEQSDFFASGNHRFYVWCAANGDFTTTARGGSAEDAQTKLYEGLKAKGRSTCWPVWQGRVQS